MDKYSNSCHITTMAEVSKFFRHLYTDIKISFHPDDDFADYGCFQDKRDIENYNRLMDECFSVCEQNNEDIYSVELDWAIRQISNNRSENND